MSDDHEELLVSTVARALDTKSKLFGFELPDLLLIFANLAILNLIFGQSDLKVPLVWGSSVLLAGFLFFAKRGRPDRYLQHFAEFIFRPGTFSAGASDTKYRPFKLNGKDNP